MFRFKDTILNLNGGIRQALSKIFGVGLQRASYFCDALGFGFSFKINNLNRFFFDCLTIIMKVFYVLDDRLKLCIFQRLEISIMNGSVSGRRYSRGLPKHGQRTHSNGKTPARRLLGGFFF